MISPQLASVREVINGWGVKSTGLYGTDYLFRAAVAKHGLGANIGQEAIYTPTFTDSKGKPLNGSNNYTVNINP
jgi:hypothetical protein